MTDAKQNDPPRTTDVSAWQQQLTRAMVRAVAIFAPAVIVIACYYDITRQIFWTIPIYWIAYVVIFVFAFWRKISYRLQTWAFIGLLYGLAILDFSSDGRGGSGRLFLLLMPFVAGLLLGRRAAIGTLAVALLSTAAAGVAFSTGLLAAPPPISSESMEGWASNVLVLLLLGAFVIASHNYVLPNLIRALDDSRRLASALDEQRAGLAAEVAERTADLARRSEQLATAAEVAHDAALIQDLERLLLQTVQLVSRRFGFYHTGIFLLEHTRQYAVLRAASSEGGQRMIARGHRLRAGQEGIVGRVTGLGTPHIALDVGSDAVFFDNADLPETRSEMALPLRARGEIIGALDVQSREPGAFDQDDVAVMQTLADQLAVAIANARLFEQLQQSLEAERRAYGEIGRRAWQKLARRQDATLLERRYDPQGILDQVGGRQEEIKRAARTGEPAMGRTPAWPSVAVPVKVRGQVVGVINAVKAAPPDADRRTWTDEEVVLLETLTDQLGAALDGARLYEETQRRAARERLAAEVTGRIRETLDLDTVLRTAAEEMRQALGLSAMTIRLAPRPDGGAAPTDESAGLEEASG